MEKKEESFESSLQKLENLVKDLENGDVALLLINTQRR